LFDRFSDIQIYAPTLGMRWLYALAAALLILLFAFLAGLFIFNTQTRAVRFFGLPTLLLLCFSPFCALLQIMYDSARNSLTVHHCMLQEWLVMLSLTSGLSVVLFRTYRVASAARADLQIITKNARLISHLALFLSFLPFCSLS